MHQTLPKTFCPGTKYLDTYALQKQLWRNIHTRGHKSTIETSTKAGEIELVSKVAFHLRRVIFPLFASVVAAMMAHHSDGVANTTTERPRPTPTKQRNTNLTDSRR